MAVIDFGTGADTATGDTLPVALGKLEARLNARAPAGSAAIDFGSGANTASGDTFAQAMAKLQSRSDALPALAAPVGFTMNGSTNPKLKAMLARVLAGTGRGRIVFKGDSTTAGAGAGGNGASTVVQLTNARPGRTSAVLAQKLTEVGYPALDNTVMADNGCQPFGVSLPAYDTRVAGNGWITATGQGNAGQAFAGGNYLYNSGDSAPFDFTPLTNVDTFETVVFNVGGAYSFSIDGTAPASIVALGASISGGVVTVPNTSAGFTKITVKAAAVGAHTLRVKSGAIAIMRSPTAYASATRAIDILNHASSGATSGDQSAVGNGWSNNDSLAFDTPDLTIINLGLNDIGNQVAVATYSANLQAIVNTAKLSGDVLLVFPHPGGSQFAVNAAAYRDAAAAVAASSGVAFLSLFNYFGGVFTPELQARMADALVHGTAEFYVEVADLYRRAILVMAA